mmetsp:Transcript_25495/g.78464  ORF Transcript_25495/g.78464 Transcript_25495/m.78464 type:complete len:280 (-) Transcript_25495:69-908(-)
MSAEWRTAIESHPAVLAAADVGTDAASFVGALVDPFASHESAVLPRVGLAEAVIDARDVGRVDSDVATKVERGESVIFAVLDARTRRSLAVTGAVAESCAVDVVALDPLRDVAQEEQRGHVDPRIVLFLVVVGGSAREDLEVVHLLVCFPADSHLPRLKTAVLVERRHVLVLVLTVRIGKRVVGAVDHVRADASEVVVRDNLVRDRTALAHVRADVGVLLVRRIGVDYRGDVVVGIVVASLAAPRVQHVVAAAFLKGLADVGDDHLIVARAPWLVVALQ